MKYFMRFIKGVDRFKQALWFIENYQDISFRQRDIDWLKNNKRYLDITYHVGLQVPGNCNGFIWIDKGESCHYLYRNDIKEVFYKTDTITIGELQ